MKAHAPDMNADIREEIRRRALQEGFDACGFTAADASANDIAALDAFLKKGWHGDMAWMARQRPQLGGGNPRGNPRALMAEARTAIVLAINYGPGGGAEVPPGSGAIAAYAQTRRDYHDVVKKKLKRLAGWIADSHGAGVKVFVDTAPVMEKPLAARAGIGDLQVCSLSTLVDLVGTGEIDIFGQIFPGKPIADSGIDLRRRHRRPAEAVEDIERLLRQGVRANAVVRLLLKLGGRPDRH